MNDDGLHTLRTDLTYAAAMCRIHYYRVPYKLPAADDAHGMAVYHKIYYNTYKGKTDPIDSMKIFERIIGKIT